MTFPKDEITVSKNLRNCKDSDSSFTVTCTINELENYFQMIFNKDLNLDMGSSTAVISVTVEKAINLPMTI